MEAVLFYTFGALTVILSLAVIVQSNPVSAAVALVGAFFGVAVIYALLDAHFVAIMQLLLYAGAIMVFFLFVIMLLNFPEQGKRWRTVAGSRLIRGSGALYLAAVFGVILWSVLQHTGGEERGAGPVGTIEAVGQLLLSKYVVPFEILSILLLVAIVGAVVMGKRDLSC